MPTDPMPTQYWFNDRLLTGDTLTLSLQEPGLLYGATVFTTLRVYENSLTHPWTAWTAHQNRLARSLQTFHWSAPKWGRVQQGATMLAQRYPVLRVTLFPDGQVLILGRSLPHNLAKLQRHGATAWVADSSDYSRSLPEHKTGNYLGCWLALQAAKRAQAQEAILIDEAERWLESSTGNLWGWADGQWWTPPLAVGILPGVLRSRLVRGLQAQQQSVVEQPWTPQQVSQFSFLAYTNSVAEVIPIHTILQRTSSVNYNPDHGRIDQLNRAWRSASY